MRLDASPTSFQAHKQDPRSSGSGPVCIQADPSVTKVFQLETTPSSRSDRCTDAELEADLWICEPSLVPDTDSPDKDPSREGKGGSGGPSMEDPTMVSIASRSVQCSSPTTTEGGPGDFTSRKGIHHAYRSPTSSRMAIVREQCRLGCLSSTASQLVTASWRSKTTSSYEPLFRKWYSWCLERDRDPTRGLVVDIADFLAELFQQGYQYRSLNAYRSAISSAHEKVDGELVGQHPLISRVLKGVFNERPLKPKYQSI